MAYCSNCGAKLKEGAKFCSGCGTKVIVQEKINEDTNKNYQRKTVFDGEVHKCPNCGEVLNSFSSICQSCGMEIRGVNANSSVTVLAQKLEEIEKRRPHSKTTSLLKMFDTADLATVNSTDEQKINLIKTFPIPNTKEDILEFCILAYSNIDEDSYRNQIRYSSKMVSEAWVSILDQVYEKAKLICDKEYMIKVEDIYVRSKDKVKTVKSKESKSAALILICTFGGLFLLFAILLGLLRITDDNKNAELKNNPNAISIEYTSTYLGDRNYKDAIRLLQNQGFINFETYEYERDDDIDEIGEVHSISIDGDDTFYKGDLFLPDDLVVIYYYI